MNRNGEQHSYAVYTRDSKMQEKSLVGGEGRNFSFPMSSSLIDKSNFALRRYGSILFKFLCGILIMVF